MAAGAIFDPNIDYLRYVQMQQNAYHGLVVQGQAVQAGHEAQAAQQGWVGNQNPIQFFRYNNTPIPRAAPDPRDAEIADLKTRIQELSELLEAEGLSECSDYIGVIL